MKINQTLNYLPHKETTVRKIVFWSISLLLLIVYLFLNFSDPDAKIWQSFQKACQEVIAAQQMESSSYTSAFKLYNNAASKLNNITTKHSSSEIALNLFRNQQKVGPYPFLEFKEEIIPRAKLKAEAENDPIDCAYYAVNLLDTVQFEDKLKLKKAAKLTEISIRYAQLWRFKKSNSVLTKGKSIVQTIYSDSFKVSALTEMAGVLGKTGKEKDALQLLSQAKTIVKNMPAHQQAAALHRIISAYCSMDQFESALEIAPKSPAPDGAWAIVSQQYATKGNLKLALETLENIEVDNLLDETLLVIIGQFAAHGQFDKAEELTAKLNQLNISRKVKALANIGYHAGKNGQKDLAVSFLEQAIEAANQFESYQLPQKLSVLNYIVFRFIELQDYQNARKLLDSNSNLAKNMSEFNRAEAFAKIAVAYGQIGDAEQAIQLIEKYIPAYLTLDVRGATLAKLALQYANQGEYQKALELAVQIDESTLLEYNRSSVLSQIAIISATAHDFKTAFEVAQKIHSSFYKPWTFCEIALLIPNRRLPFSKKPQVKQYLHQIITELEPQNSKEAFPVTE